MRKIELGQTGVEVSSVCLGTMYFGNRDDKETSYDLLDQYVEAGGAFLDTANVYAMWVPGFQGGESETLLGQWMRDRKNRDEMFIATKSGFNYSDVERGLSAEQVESECDKSLKRLGIDTIDLYYAHEDDRNTRQEERLEAYDRLVKAGKVRFIGASNYRAWRLQEARDFSRAKGWPEFCCVQQRYSYLRPTPGATFGPQLAVNNDLLDYVKQRRMTLLAYSPLLSGAYTRADRAFPAQYEGADSEARLKVLREVAEETGDTVNQVVLAWLMQSEPAVIPVIGAGSREQMSENLDATGVSLSTEQMSRLNEACAETKNKPFQV